MEQKINHILKPETAYDWDNVGLQIGTLDKPIHKMLLTLDVTLDVVEEAIDKKCEVIIAHHPLIFRPLKQIVPTSHIGKIVLKIIENNLSLYVAHTNFDCLENGMNDYLATLLGIENQSVFEPITEDYGLGVVGTIKKAPLKDVAEHVKNVFQLESLDIIGDENHLVETMAIVGGSGGSAIGTALSQNVDVFVTGDITYHNALDARAMGLNIIHVNHNIEKLGLNRLKELLTPLGKELIISSVDTNPYILK